MTDRPLPSVVQRQLAMHKLTKFYKTFAPEKLANVPQLYENYRTALPKLFAELLQRYPRCPRDYFDDVIPTLSVPPLPDEHYTSNTMMAMPSPLTRDRGDGSFMMSSFNSSVNSSSPFLGRSHEDVASHQHSISGAMALLQRGESLLEATPVLSKPSPAGRSQEDGEYDPAVPLDWNESAQGDDIGAAVDERSPDRRDRDASASSTKEAIDLRLLIQENRQLARDVAVAEQQVLQRRFEILYMKLVELPEASSTQDNSSNSSSSASVRVEITIRDDQRSGRVFSIEGSEEQRKYMLETAIAAPHAPVKRDMCTVTFRFGKGGSTFESHVAQRNIVAMAMRVWSRKAPHTVSEHALAPEHHQVGENIIGFHPSTTLWWQWPELCTSVKGVAPEPMLQLLTPHSLFSSTYLPALIAKAESGAGAEASGGGSGPIHPQVAKVFADAPPPPNLLSNERGSDSSAFWSHFILQWETLSQQISHGKLTVEQQ